MRPLGRRQRVMEFWSVPDEVEEEDRLVVSRSDRQMEIVSVRRHVVGVDRP